MKRSLFAEAVSAYGHDAFIERAVRDGLVHTVQSDRLPSECASWFDDYPASARRWVFSVATCRTTYCFADADEAFAFKMLWG